MNWLFYLKTTETCNLNCKHCFTNGTSGAKIYWNKEKVSKWLKDFREEVGPGHSAHCEFHGGEPFLVDVEEMKQVYDECKDLWNNMSWGVTTNLVFKLSPSIIEFIKGPLDNRLATSWDPDIRFANPKQYDLWRNNVRTLINEGVTLKLFVSVTKGTVKMNPIDLLEWIRDLGVKEVSFERLTHNGSANKNPDIFPSNVEQDAWFLRMHQQSEQANARTWFNNEFLENVYTKFESGFNKAGTFCRDCEEKLFTLNADGSIAGCPNSAPEQYFGHIDTRIHDLLKDPARINNIACERSRDPRCYSCDVFEFCGGDCHQLSWEDDQCGAPRSLMQLLAGINTLRSQKIFKIEEIK
jgi:radical SAM protein with 4Fe4S-binding SPASM domain